MKNWIGIAVLPALLVGMNSLQLAKAATPAAKAELPAASEVLLKISGKSFGGGKAVNLTLGDLQKLASVKIRSTTQYVGSAEFEGPRMRDILKAAQVPATTKEVILVGADGYRARAPMSDFDKYDVVVAHSMNGKRLTLDSKGPLWVMYPNEKHRELIGHATNDKLVWSFVQIEIP